MDTAQRSSRGASRFHAMGSDAHVIVVEDEPV
jgi:hypothetical protein